MGPGAADIAVPGPGLAVQGKEAGPAQLLAGFLLVLLLVGVGMMGVGWRSATVFVFIRFVAGHQGDPLEGAGGNVHRGVVRSGDSEDGG